MNKHLPASIRSKSLPLLGIILAALFWLTDSTIDVYIFDEGDTFLESLLTPEPIELWMRSLVVVLLLLFSSYAQQLLTAQRNVATELNRFKDRLEELVDIRTKEIEKINTDLQEEIQERKKVEQELEILATIDPLTLIFNRRKFDDILTYEMERDRRYRFGLSLIFCDIDHFKQVNDNFGHDTGDNILVLFATVKESIRESDIIARWGGEEFVILIPNTTAEIAGKVAEKIRQKIETTTFPTAGKITASFGVTHFLGDDNRDTIVKRADQALYKAKENGRNTVETLLG